MPKVCSFSSFWTGTRMNLTFSRSPKIGYLLIGSKWIIFKVVSGGITTGSTETSLPFWMEIRRRRLQEWHFWRTPQRGNRRKFICFKWLIHFFSTERLTLWILELGLFTARVDFRYEPDLIELQRIWILIQEVLITVDGLRKRAGNFKAFNFDNNKLRKAVRKILLLE